MVSDEYLAQLLAHRFPLHLVRVVGGSNLSRVKLCPDLISVPMQKSYRVMLVAFVPPGSATATQWPLRCPP